MEDNGMESVSEKCNWNILV